MTRSRTLKVGALLLYAFVCLMFATPTGSRLSNKQVWDSQHNKEEFEAWASGLGALGGNLSGREFQDALWRVTTTYLERRDRLLRPLAWMSRQLGFVQSWKMFSNPQTSPSRLWIELDSGRGFTPLFVVGSDEHTWRRDFFAHHRIRKLLGRIGRAGRAPEYKALCNWIAKAAAQDFPRAQAVRVSMYTWSTRPPNEDYKQVVEPEFGRPGGDFARVKTFDLRKFRR